VLLQHLQTLRSNKANKASLNREVFIITITATTKTASPIYKGGFNRTLGGLNIGLIALFISFLGDCMRIM
jgi:hypothetical protein